MVEKEFRSTMATDITGAHLVADLVLFARDTADLHVLLIKRSEDSDAFPGYWAVTGGYLNDGETFEQAARREALEESGLTSDLLRQVGIYDAPDRDPRGRVVSVAYTAVLPDMPTPRAGDDASAARWWPVSSLPPLPFDHARIIADAMSNHVCTSAQPTGPSRNAAARAASTRPLEARWQWLRRQITRRS